MESVRKYEDKIELNSNEWMSWDAEEFNNWRRSHDFPRIVAFLYDSLPNFAIWLSEQDGLSKDDLLFHGPARFIRYYGQRINYVVHDIVPPSIRYQFLLSDELETRLNKIKRTKKVEFSSYIDWAIRTKIIDIEGIISCLTPSGISSNDRHCLDSHSSIQFNIPLHMPNRPVTFPLDISQITRNHTVAPRLELLKLGGKNITIDDAYIDEKNFEFTNLDNLTLSSPTIRSFQQFTFCTLRNFNIIGDIHAATFHQCSVEITVKRGRLSECRFEYGSSNINLDNSALSRCAIKEKSLSLNLIASEILDSNLEYEEIVANNPSLKQSFHKAAKIIYSRLGYPDLAGEHFLLEQTAKRKELWQKTYDFDSKFSAKTKIKSLLSSIWMYTKEVYWGYGEKPFNIIRFILFLITVLSVINFGYCKSDTYLDAIKSLTFTFQSFTNISIVEVEQNNNILNLLSSFLSFFGLISVGLLVASLSAKSELAAA